MKLTAGTLDERIITTVKERYPITLEELIDVLHERPSMVRHRVKVLAQRGILILEPLGDKTYIRPGRGVGFVGINPKQKRAMKHGKKKKKVENEEVEGYI